MKLPDCGLSATVGTPLLGPQKVPLTPVRHDSPAGQTARVPLRVLQPCAQAPETVQMVPGMQSSLPAQPMQVLRAVSQTGVAGVAAQSLFEWQPAEARQQLPSHELPEPHMLLSVQLSWVDAHCP